MVDVPDAPWIGLDREEYEELYNPFYKLEKEAEYEAERADLEWKIMQEEKNEGRRD